MIPSKNGEVKAFEKIFCLYFPRLHHYATNLLHDEEEAKDLVQDVFCQLWENGSLHDDEKNIGAFLFTLTRNKCLNLLKHKIVENKYLVQKVKFEAEELYHISMADSEEFVSIEQELMDELGKIMNEMPEKFRLAFWLKWFDGKKIREIASIMNISTTMVDRHLTKGLRIVRKKLDSNIKLGTNDLNKMIK